MAPTICSEKKRQIRPGTKDIRRQSTTVATAMTTATTNSSNPISNSTIISYVAKGSLNARTAASLRVRGISTQNSDANADKNMLQMYTERLEVTDPNDSANSSQQQHDQRELQLISDNAVSSSTHRDSERNRTDAHRYDASMPSSPFAHSSSSSYQYSDADADMYAAIDTDDDDAEVHSIITGKCSKATPNNQVTHRQMLRCTVKTVFATSAVNNDGNHCKQPTAIGRSTTNNHTDSNKDNSSSGSGSGKNTCKSSCDSHNSDTYANMCEIKNTEGLLAIALKTIKLVKRNQLLQRRLAQLQLETSEFIQSVLANPENRHFREKVQPQPAKMEDLEWKGGRNMAEV